MRDGHDGCAIDTELRVAPARSARFRAAFSAIASPTMRAQPASRARRHKLLERVDNDDRRDRVGAGGVRVSVA